MLPTIPWERYRSILNSTSSSSSRIAIFVSWGVVEMINSFCIGTPVPVDGGAQGHVETRRPEAKVTYCHGELLCPEELGSLNFLKFPAQLLNGQKLCKSFDALIANAHVRLN